MTQWLLMIQLATSFQTLGPVNEKTTCLDIQAQMLLHFKALKTACVSVTIPAPAAPAAK